MSSIGLERRREAGDRPGCRPSAPCRPRLFEGRHDQLAGRAITLDDSDKAVGKCGRLESGKRRSRSARLRTTARQVEPVLASPLAQVSSWHVSKIAKKLVPTACRARRGAVVETAQGLLVDRDDDINPGPASRSDGRVVGCLANHHEVICCSAGRSERSLDRARSAGAVLVGELQNAVEATDVVVSICPPDAAVAVAEAVDRLGFSGLYLDANAISPATMETVARQLSAADVVDGGVIGPPAWVGDSTRLYVSGAAAQYTVARVVRSLTLGSHGYRW